MVKWSRFKLVSSSIELIVRWAQSWPPIGASDVYQNVEFESANGPRRCSLD